MSVNKGAAVAAGSAVLLVLLMSTLPGNTVKAYLPNVLGYSRLGWVHSGAQARFGLNLPKWAGAEGLFSAIQFPLRHPRVYLKQGQRIVVDYNLKVERGGMRLVTYRTNLLGLIEDHYYSDGFGIGDHRGRYEYTAPEDGHYRFEYKVFPFEYPDKDGTARPGRMTVPLRNFEVVYDISWRLER